jgi:hypothetical protein
VRPWCDLGRGPTHIGDRVVQEPTAVLSPDGGVYGAVVCVRRSARQFGSRVPGDRTRATARSVAVRAREVDDVTQRGEVLRRLRDEREVITRASRSSRLDHVVDDELRGECALSLGPAAAAIGGSSTAVMQGEAMSRGMMCMKIRMSFLLGSRTIDG